MHRDHTPTCWLPVWTRLYLCTNANQKPTDPAWEKSSNRHTILFIFCLQYAYFSSKQWSYFNLYRRRGHHNILIYMFLYVAWEKPKKYEDSTYKYLKVLSKSKSVSFVPIFFKSYQTNMHTWSSGLNRKWGGVTTVFPTEILRIHADANGLCITKKKPHPCPTIALFLTRKVIALTWPNINYR